MSSYIPVRSASSRWTRTTGCCWCVSTGTRSATSCSSRRPGCSTSQGEQYRLGGERELWEETATKAADWRILVDAFTSPGLTNEAVRIFLARDLSPAPESFERLHEEADMETVWAPLVDVVGAALAGDLQNPILIMGALAAWTALNGPGFENLRPADSPWPAKDHT